MPLPEVLQGKLRLPVIGAPMFIVSTPKLVLEQCKAGIVGSFPALNARPKETLEEWLKEITTELSRVKQEEPGKIVAPFAVNQIVHQTNDRLEHDLHLCAKYKVPIVITSLRAPNEVVETVHSYGGIVLHDVINVRHARKAVEAGVDGLILVCAGAGGHAGMHSPMALVSEVRAFFDGPLVLSGAITRGCHIVAAQALGADLAYMGTRFIATQEANAADEYKTMIVSSAAADVVYTNLFTGVHGNYLAGSLISAGLDPENLPAADKLKMNYGSSGNSDKRVWRDIWGAGQGTGSIEDIPSVLELVERLARDYESASKNLTAQLNGWAQPLPLLP